MYQCQCGHVCRSQKQLTRHQKKCQQVMNTTFILKDMYDAYNTSVFGGRLPTIPVTYSDHLELRAGMTQFKFRRLDDGEVDLSSVITEILISSPAHFIQECYIRNALVHEMCHVAAFYLDNMPLSHSDEESHGPTWVKWTDHASAVHPELGPITKRASFIKWSYSYICNCVEPKREGELIDWGLRQITGSQIRKAKGDRCPVCYGTYILL